MEIPGFRRVREAGAELWVAEELAEAVLALGLLRAVAPGAPGPRGRAPTTVLELPGRAQRIHLRPVHHGGALARVSRDRLWGLTRPLSELAVCATLSERGAPVPAPALVVGHRIAGPLWRASVGTLHEDGVDGVALLRAAPDRERVGRAARAAGAAVRAFHAAGARHPDLHLGNLLFRETAGETRALVVDLDGVRLGPPPAPGERMAELMRLYRSLVKRGLDDGVGPLGFGAFLDAYTGGDGALARALVRHLPRERVRLALHRLHYGSRGR